MGPHDLNSIQKLLPNEDCTMCEAPSCATLARRIVAGEVKPEKCPLVDKRNVDRIHKILREGVKTNQEVAQDQTFVEIQPCAEYGRVTLEAQLPKPEGSKYDLFDGCTMCTAFSDISDLDGVRCSLELGYGLAQLEEKRIHVFRSGKVTMRRAYDRRDAYETLEKISWSLWPSVICSCGCTVQECVSCACPDCRFVLCKGIEWAVRNIPHEAMPMARIMENLEDMAKGDDDGRLSLALEKHNAVMGYIARLERLMRKADEALSDQDREAVEAIREEFHEIHMELAQGSIELLTNTRGPARVLGLILNGAELNMKNMGKAMFSIRDKERYPMYQKALEIALDGIGAFMERDGAMAGKIEERCKAFRKGWTDSEFSRNREYILKLAYFGCNMARMLDRPLPHWKLKDEVKASETTSAPG